MMKSRAGIAGLLMAALVGLASGTGVTAAGMAGAADASSGTRAVGVGENLGRDKKSTTLNYVLYGGRVFQADGKPTLVLHKVERAGEGNSFIISYHYVQPDEIYLQGTWMKILSFDNIQLKFVVIEGREPISAGKR